MGTRRKRRRWSEDEKWMICSQTRVEGVSVAQVARRYDLNANQIFNWLKNPRFAADGDVPAVDGQFLPVEIVDEPAPSVPVRSDVQITCSGLRSRTPNVSATSGLIELELTSGHRLRISGDCNPDAIGKLVRSLS